MTFHLSPGCTINVSEGGCRASLSSTNSRLARNVRWVVTASRSAGEVYARVGDDRRHRPRRRRGLKAEAMLKRIPEISFPDSRWAHVSCLRVNDEKRSAGIHTISLSKFINATRRCTPRSDVSWITHNHLHARVSPRIIKFANITLRGERASTWSVLEKYIERRARSTKLKSTSSKCDCNTVDCRRANCGRIARRIGSGTNTRRTISYITDLTSRAGVI